MLWLNGNPSGPNVLSGLPYVLYGGPTTIPLFTATHTGIQFPSRVEALLHFFFANSAIVSRVGSGIFEDVES